VSALGSQRIRAVEAHYPAAGMWWASVILEGGAVPAAGKTTLQIADLAMPGTVLGDQAGFDAGDLPGAVVVGGAGWLADVIDPATGLPPSWQGDGGLRLLTVLRTLARISGETLAEPADAPLRNAYAVAAGQLRSALSLLVARVGLGSWWVEPSTGLTRFGSRTGSAAAPSLYNVTRRNLRRGVRRLALVGNVAAFLPGNSVEGATVARLVVREEASKLTAEAWS
jgi:hypothetical protein